MDAMGKLVKTHDVQAEDVKHVKVRTGINVLPPGPLRYQVAQSSLEGMLYVPFEMARLIVKRKAGFKEFNDYFVR